MHVCGGATSEGAPQKDHVHPGHHATEPDIFLNTKQPLSQTLSPPERKTLVASGHVVPRFWHETNQINVRLF